MGGFLDESIVNRNVELAQHVSADLLTLQNAIIDPQTKRPNFSILLTLRISSTQVYHAEAAIPCSVHQKDRSASLIQI